MTQTDEQEIILISRQAIELANEIFEQQRQEKMETRVDASPTGIIVSEEVVKKFLSAWKIWKNFDTGKFEYFLNKHKVELSQATFELLQELRKMSGELDDGK